MDEKGKCFKRYYTDAEYYITPGGEDSGCDQFATLDVQDTGKGVMLTQGSYKMHNILKDNIYYLGMTESSDTCWEGFSMYMADPPDGSKDMVQSNLLTNVQYDMANGKANLEPTRVGSVKCSMGAGSASVKLSQTETASETSTFASSTELDAAMTLSVEAGVPLTVKVTDTYTMSMSETTTFTNGKTWTKVHEDDVTVNCPSNSEEIYDMVWEKGTYDIPYVADLERVIKVNGVPTKYVFQGITGVYNGISGETITICDELAQGSNEVCNFDVVPIALN